MLCSDVYCGGMFSSVKLFFCLPVCLQSIFVELSGGGTEKRGMHPLAHTPSPFLPCKNFDLGVSPAALFIGGLYAFVVED